MSDFVEHTPCPKCHSRDNLGVYTDHEYCFGCGHIHFYNYHNRRILGSKDTGERIVSLPDDIVSYVPAVASEWIKKYDLTQKELYDNRVVWSDLRELLIFPYFDDQNHLWGWQGRYFGSNPKHPKWVGKGNFKERTKVYGKTSESIVIVEDIISCIKVSRVTGALPLFGSFVDLNKICFLYKEVKPKKYVLWLDRDKVKESYVYCTTILKLGIPCEVVSTHKDPKEFSFNEIKELLKII